MIFLGLKFWPKVIFWDYERYQEFLGREEKQRNFWGLQKKRTKGFFSRMLKKSSDILG